MSYVAEAVGTYEDPDPDRDALNRYEATPKGEREFVEWLHATTIAPSCCAKRCMDGSQLGEPEDLPIIIRGIRNEERVCQREFRECRKSLEGIEAGIHNATDWRYEARAAVMGDALNEQLEAACDVSPGYAEISSGSTTSM